MRTLKAGKMERLGRGVGGNNAIDKSRAGREVKVEVEEEEEEGEIRGRGKEGGNEDGGECGHEGFKRG